MTLSPEEKIEVARRAEAAALESDPRISQLRGRGVLRSSRSVHVCEQRRLRRQLRDLVVQPRGSPVASQNGDMQRDSWYHVTRKRERLDAPEEIGASRRRVPCAGWARDGSSTVEAPVIFDPGHGRVPGAAHGRGGVRTRALPAARHSSRQARRTDRRARRDHRGRWRHARGARIAALRRRGAALCEDAHRGQGRALVVRARHLLRPQARAGLHPSRRARR